MSGEMTRRAALVAGCFLWLAAGDGCSARDALPPGTDDYNKATGLLRGVEEFRFETLRRGTLSGMKELKLRPLQREADAFNAFIVGETANGQECRIRLKRMSSFATEIQIRILFTRDEQKLRLILDTIREHARGHKAKRKS